MEWHSPPSALERLMRELFEAQPEDLLSWVYQAVWQLHAQELRGESGGPLEYSPLMQRRRVSRPWDEDSRIAMGRSSTNSGRSGYSILQKPRLSQATEQKMAQARTVDSRYSDRTSGSVIGMSRMRRPTELESVSSLEELEVNAVTTGSTSHVECYVSNQLTSVASQPMVEHERESWCRHFGVTQSGQWERPFRTSTSVANSHSLKRMISFTVRPTGEETHSTSCLLHPLSKLRLRWDTLFFICLAVDIWATPFELVFVDVEDLPPWYVYARIFVLAIFVVDIVLNFCTGFVEHGDVVMVRSRIVRQYLKFWFWVDLIATSSEAIASWGNSIRIVRSFKAYRLLKAVRLIRSMRLGNKSWLFTVMNTNQLPNEWILALFLGQGNLILAILAHLNASVWASLGGNSDDLPVAAGPLTHYCASLRQAYGALTFGKDLTPATSWSQAIFGIFVSVQRATLWSFVTAFIIWRVLLVLESDAGVTTMKESTIKYLKHHRVSNYLQMKVYTAIAETSTMQRHQQHLEKLMSHCFPVHLQKELCYELWSQRLLTNDLVMHLTEWDPCFVKELTTLVREDVIASNVVVFTAGEQSTEAYLVLQGVLSVSFSEIEEQKQDYLAGMWIGITSLVNPSLRRLQTVVCTFWSELMVVPAKGFQKLVVSHHLMERLNALLEERLWMGLCDRCGSLGDHFPNKCPLLHQSRRKSKQFISATGLPVRKSSGLTRMAPFTSTASGATGTPKFKLGRANSTTQPKSDLGEFLRSHGMERLHEHLIAQGVSRLDDVRLSNVEAIKNNPDVGLSLEEECALSDAFLSEFKKKIKRQATHVLRTVANQATDCHFLFLSHYKAEAGSVAALMQENLVSLIKEDTANAANHFSVPVFLDSNDLQDLNDLKKHVLQSHNLVLLLTPKVLTRPWCLVEIFVAVKSGVPVVPVLVDQPTGNFIYPDEAYYTRLRRGKVLDAEVTRFLSKHNVELPELESALRQAFMRIAVPFSPMKSATIRRAELVDLVKKCEIRENMVPVSTEHKTRELASVHFAADWASAVNAAAMGNPIRALKCYGKSGHEYALRRDDDGQVELRDTPDEDDFPLKILDLANSRGLSPTLPPNRSRSDTERSLSPNRSQKPRSMGPEREEGEELGVCELGQQEESASKNHTKVLEGFREWL
jgi:hypothetical protein